MTQSPTDAMTQSPTDTITQSPTDAITQSPTDAITQSPTNKVNQNIFDANQYINLICNNDSKCQIYYNNLLIQGQYTSISDEKSDQKLDEKSDQKSDEKSDAHKWLSSLKNIPLWTHSPEYSIYNTNQQTPIDNYSYFGALQSKGSDFIPITSDFSSFRK